MDIGRKYFVSVVLCLTLMNGRSHGNSALWMEIAANDNEPEVEPLNIEMFLADFDIHGALPFLDVHMLSPQEAAFQYFNNHDYDNSRSLDGLELLQALSHDHGIETGSQRRRGDDIANTETIDKILEIHDSDGDGYLTVTEFMRQIKLGKEVSRVLGHLPLL